MVEPLYTPVSVCNFSPLNLPAPTFRSINDLIRNHKIPGPNLLLQTAHSTKSNNSSHANASQRRNIRSRVHLMWSKLVVLSVAGEEGNGNIVVLQDVDWC